MVIKWTLLMFGNLNFHQTFTDCMSNHTQFFLSWKARCNCKFWFYCVFIHNVSASLPNFHKLYILICILIYWFMIYCFFFGTWYIGLSCMTADFNVQTIYIKLLVMTIYSYASLGTTFGPKNFSLSLPDIALKAEKC